MLDLLRKTEIHQLIQIFALLGSPSAKVLQKISTPAVSVTERLFSLCFVHGQLRYMPRVLFDNSKSLLAGHGIDPCVSAS